MMNGAGNTPKVHSTTTSTVGGASSPSVGKLSNDTLSKLSKGYSNQSAENQQDSPVQQPKTTIKPGSLSLVSSQGDKEGPAKQSLGLLSDSSKNSLEALFSQRTAKPSVLNSAKKPGGLKDSEGGSKLKSAKKPGGLKPSSGLESLFGNRAAKSSALKPGSKTASTGGVKKWAKVQTEEKSATSVMKQLDSFPQFKEAKAAIQNAAPGSSEAKFKKILDSFEANFNSIDAPENKVKTVLGFYLMEKNADKLAGMKEGEAKELSASFGGLTFHPERYPSEDSKASFLKTSSGQIHSTFEACKEAGDEARFFNEGFSMACFEDSFAQLYGLNEKVASEQEVASSGADNPLKAAFTLNKSVDDILPLAMEAAAEFDADKDGNFADWASKKYGIPESAHETMKQVEKKLDEYGML